MALRALVFDFDGLIVYVNEKPADEEILKGILIYDSRSQDIPQTIAAEEGVMVNYPESLRVSLRLRNGSIHQVTEEGEKYQVIRFATYEVNLDTRSLLGDAGRLERAGKNHSLYVIKEKLKRYKKTGKRYNALLVEYYKKFSLPAACLIIGFVGAPLGVRNRRSGRSGGLALSLMIIIIYYILLSMGEGLGDDGRIPPMIAMWLPNLVLAAIGVYLTVKIHQDSPFRLAALFIERIQIILEKLRNRFLAQWIGSVGEGEQA